MESKFNTKLCLKQRPSSSNLTMYQIFEESKKIKKAVIPSKLENKFSPHQSELRVNILNIPDEHEGSPE